MGHDLFLRHKVGQHLGLMGHGTQTATHEDLETPLDLSVDLTRLGQVSKVVQLDQTTGFVFTAGEGDLDLAPEVLNIVVTQQEPGQGVGVGRDVEGLGAADAREGTGGDVAYRVAARLTRGDTDGGQAAHEIGRVVDVDEG